MSEQMPLTIEIIREKEYKIDEDFKIINYLSLSTKKILINRILDLCIIDEDIKKIDFALKKFAYEYVMVNEFSNIYFEVEDVVELYDELKEKGIIDQVIKLIPESEKEFIDYVLRKEIEQIQLVENSLASVVSKSLNKLVEKLPTSKEISKMIPKLSKEISKIDGSKLKFIADAIGWKNGVDKKDQPISQ